MTAFDQLFVVFGVAVDQPKKDAPRISIGGRLVADLLVAAGAGRMLAMTLHSPQVHGFFGIPVDHLHALRELAAHFRQYDLSNTTVVTVEQFGRGAQTHRRPTRRAGDRVHQLRAGLDG